MYWFYRATTDGRIYIQEMTQIIFVLIDRAVFESTYITIAANVWEVVFIYWAH
jgi:hypothetical protein